MTTKELAKFTAGLKYEDLSSVSIEMAKKCILDWLGVSIRGSQELPAKIIRDTILNDKNGEAVVFDKKYRRASVFDAALCNAAASHTLDFDDLHNSSIVHLATVVVPGVFSVAEKEHKSGKQMISAVCAGYEAGARIGESVIPESYFYWHTTGIAGVFGAAAAAANLLGLSEEATLMCYGSAGTQAAGLWEFLKEGAMSKTLHAGKSSYAGVLSAYLAQNGFTGASRILEGEKGFCHAVSSNPHLELLTADLDIKHLKIDDNSFKPYPCCKHSHAAVYAAEVLKKEHMIVADDVEKVKVYVNNVTDILINNPYPHNPYGCKFSIQYCIAAMLNFGTIALEHFSEKYIYDKDVRALMARIEVINSPEIEAMYQKNPTKLASHLKIYFKDGKCLEMIVDHPKGDKNNPFTWNDAENKFMLLTGEVYGDAIAESLCSMIKNLEKCKDFSKDISQCLGGEH